MRLGRLFVKGLAVGIPVVLTITILYWLAVNSERGLGKLLRLVLPDSMYIPGMGLLFGLVLILLIGLLSHVLVIQRLFIWGESLIARLPLVRTIYSAIRDFVQYFNPANTTERGRVALVHFPDQDMVLVGFITRETTEGLPDETLLHGRIAVYLPMSYQIGGYTLYLPRDRVTPVDLTFEQAMRLTLTGGVTTDATETASLKPDD